MSWHHYVDSLDVLRVAIRYDDDLEEDRPATSLEALLLRPEAGTTTRDAEFMAWMRRHAPTQLAELITRREQMRTQDGNGHSQPQHSSEPK